MVLKKLQLVAEEAAVLLLLEIAVEVSIKECEISNPKHEKDLDKPSESPAVSDVGSVAEGTLKVSTEFKCKECDRNMIF